MSIVVLAIDIIFFASDAGYYWLTLFDHYTIGLNLMIFLLVQTYVFTKYLPLEKLVIRVNNFGEKFPDIYIWLIKNVIPYLLALLIVFGILNEFIHPVKAPFWGIILALFVFLLPGASTLLFYYKDPLKEKNRQLSKMELIHKKTIN